MTTIIISYRREDTELMVGRICDRLRDHFGRDSVMVDIDSIPYGLDFRKHIKEALKRCAPKLAIIGPRWIALNEEGRSRLIDAGRKILEGQVRGRLVIRVAGLNLVESFATKLLEDV